MRILKFAETHRLLIHALLFTVAALAVVITKFVIPTESFARVLTLGLGYLSLLLMAITLLIGPLQLLMARRRCAVNIYFRRDIGIWAGLTAIVHVIFGFQLHFGGHIPSYFFRPDSLIPLINPFGVSNYIGLAATIAVLALLVTSNDISMRWLKGKRWKLLQRLNYVLFPAVLVHTVSYQLILKRTPLLLLVALTIFVAVLLFQLKGYQYYRMRWPSRKRSGLPATERRAR